MGHGFVRLETAALETEGRLRTSDPPRPRNVGALGTRSSIYIYTEVPRYASAYTPISSLYAPVPGQQLQPYRPMKNVYPAIPPPGVLDLVPHVMRPQSTKAIDYDPSVTPVEILNNTVYVGKIASSVENDFVRNLLQLCGPIKSWKRPQDPTNGEAKAFGLCEFESADGVLRALRLLSDLNIDGQQLMINVNKATREHLERCVEKKSESLEKLKVAQSPEKSEPRKPTDDVSSLFIVTDDDREADLETLEKLRTMIEKRLKNNPFLPPSSLPATDGLNTLNSEHMPESEDGNLNFYGIRNGENKGDEKLVHDSKPSRDRDKKERSSAESARKKERKIRDRKRGKLDEDEELETWERDLVKEHAARRKRKQEYENKEDARKYKARVANWEYREKNKEFEREEEREREKERKYDRKAILDEELKRDYGGFSTSERKRRRREKENDLADRLKEEEEVAEAKRRFMENKASPFVSEINGSDKVVLAHKMEEEIEDGEVTGNEHLDQNHIGDDIIENGAGHESVVETSALDMLQNSNGSSKELGFGLVGTVTRILVPSIFNQEGDEDAFDELKMRPLVPIDFSTEELQALQSLSPGTPTSNLDAAAEFAKQISRTTSREDELNVETELRNDKEEILYIQKLLDAKQLIDMIPMTKEELFSYDINWALCDENELNDRIRPWISEKIVEFFGDEEPTLVDYIVSSTNEHLKASEMLDRLESILDDEAEMFVLDMWKILILETRKIETELSNEVQI